jgi:large subunit ribosomal protein L4
MKLPVRDAQGGKLKAIEVDDQVFGMKPNTAVIYQAFLAQMANRRAGSASTKSRGEVRGSTAKVRVQKGSGHARQGSARAPHRTGGGVAFGPRPRSYRQALPKRMKRLAIRSVLSGKVADGQLAVVDELSLERPRTKEIAGLLQSLGIERSALVVTGNADRMVYASARNLARIKALPAAYLNVLDMLTHRDLVMTVAAVRRCEELWGGDRARQRRPLPVQAAPLAAAKTARRPRAVKAPEVVEEAPSEAEEVVQAPAATKTPRRPRATKTAKIAEEASGKAEVVEGNIAKTARRPRAVKAPEVVEEAPSEAEEVVQAPAATKTPRRPRATKAAKIVEEAAVKPEAVEGPPQADAEQEAS